MFLNIKKQAGNLYIVVLFVIIAMGFLASALMRIEWSNNDAFTRDILATRSWFAAHSVNEYVLTQMYPLNQASSSVPLLCTTPMPAYIVNAANKLISHYVSCSAVRVECSKSEKSINDQYLYILKSSVTCGSNSLKVERQQEIWLKE